MAAPTSVLVVCTGNIYRSPLAAAALRHRLLEAGIGVVVGSAGVAPVVGQRVPTGLLQEVGRQHPLHPDLEAHRARSLNSELIEQATVIVAMAREHIRAVVAQVPTAFGRTFTLKELVRRTEASPIPLASDLSDWLAHAHHGRSARGLLNPDERDDVKDPLGRSQRVLQEVVSEVCDLVARVQLSD